MAPTAECSSCGGQGVPGAKFCRHCGAALEATKAEATPPDAERADQKQGVCPACSAPVPPGASFCRSCGERQPETASEGPPMAAPPPPPPGARPASPPQTPAPPPSGNRGPLLALAAVAGCLALGGLVFGGVYLLTREDDGASYDPSLAPLGEVGGSPGGGSVEGTPSIPSESPVEPAQPELEPEFEEAREVFRSHWDAIADGRYGDAFDLFHPGYEAERSGWISTHETEATLVNMDSITVEPGVTDPYDDELWLYVEVPVRDGGGSYAGDCRLFFGEVRMDRSGGSLMYRPGVSNGREGSFGRSELGGGIKDLSEASPRCP